MAVEKTVVIVVEGDEAIREVEKLNDQLDQTNKEIDDINSNSGQGFDNAAKGAGKFKTAINAVGVALKAAGIGLVLAALVKITDIFKSSPSGARIIAKALNTVNIVMLELYHNAAVLGDLLSALFRADFIAVGALSAMFKEQIGNALDLGEAYTNMQFAVKALDDSLILLTSRQLRIMEQNRVIADDTDRSAEDRMAAANRIEQAALTLFKAQEVRFNKELEMLNTLDVLNAEQVTRRFELLAEIEAGEEEYNARLAELLGIRRGIIDEYAGNYEDAFKEGGAFASFDMENPFVKMMEAEVEAQENLTQRTIEENDKRAKDNEATTKANIQLAKEEAAAKDAAFTATAQALTNLSIIAGKETAAGKALAIAAAIINVHQGVTKALAQGGWLGIAMGAAVATAGFLSIKAIIDTPVPGESGGSSSSSGISTPSAPSFNVVGATQTSSLEQQLATEGIRVSQDTPLKSYVVASDVTTQAALDRQIEANAGF